MRRLRVVLLTLYVAAIGLAVAGPLLGPAVVRSAVLPKVADRLGRAVRVGDVWVRWGRLELRDLEVDGAGAATPIKIPRVRARFQVWPLLIGRVVVRELVIEQPRVVLVRGQEGEDNVTSILDRLRARRASEGGKGSGGARVRVEHVHVEAGQVALLDASLGEVRVGRVDAELDPNGEGDALLGELSVKLYAGPTLSARKLAVRLPLSSGRLDGFPTIEVADGVATPVHGLRLTGIHGTVSADPADPLRANLDIRGSYFGAERELWKATGWLRPTAREGEFHLRADRFKLAQLAGLMEGPEAVDARNAEVDARFDVSYRQDQVVFGGAFHLLGLTVAHPMLAPVPVPRLGFDARVKGSLDLAAHKLHLTEAVIDYKKVHASLTAEVENLGRKPRFAATLQVRPLPCQAALDALPPELVPNLQGFKLEGTFSTDLHLGLDLEDLETPVDLGGKVGIEGCKVLEAPPWVDATARLSSTFVQTVQTEPGHWRSFFAGPENPDWTPYADISPFLVASIMTTEDSGFFKHHGFIPAEFRTALQQNLQRGYFRLGASSITMQMVKNVLLSREKTLSRKLQEMFLTWYVEHQLSKERILEIYFNVIEFGPDLYGIGRATKHYFGKSPKDLEPQEAAWFSSILPNPKRRYAHFCRPDGRLDDKWDAYVKRIMRRSHERGRLSDEDYQRALETPFQFDRDEAPPEKECLALVKRVTTPPGTVAAPIDPTRN